MYVLINITKEAGEEAEFDYAEVVLLVRLLKFHDYALATQRLLEIHCKQVIM